MSHRGAGFGQKKNSKLAVTVLLKTSAAHCAQ